MSTRIETITEKDLVHGISMGTATEAEMLPDAPERFWFERNGVYRDTNVLLWDAETVSFESSRWQALSFGDWSVHLQLPTAAHFWGRDLDTTHAYGLFARRQEEALESLRPTSRVHPDVAPRDLSTTFAEDAGAIYENWRLASAFIPTGEELERAPTFRGVDIQYDRMFTGGSSEAEEVTYRWSQPRELRRTNDRLPTPTPTPTFHPALELLQYQRDLGAAIEFRTQVWAQGGEWNWTQEDLGLVAPEGVEALDRRRKARCPVRGPRSRPMIQELTFETLSHSIPTDTWAFESLEQAHEAAGSRMQAWPHHEGNPYIHEERKPGRVNGILADITA